MWLSMPLSLYSVHAFVVSCNKSVFWMQTASRLRGVLPVVVDADYWEDIGEALDDIFIPEAEIW